MAFEYGTRHKTKQEKCVSLLVNCSQLELAYLSGIIDGEGSITLDKMQNGNFRPSLTITNTDVELIDYLHKYFWQAVKKCKNNRQVPFLRVQLCGFSLDPFLAAIEPFLVAKKLQCNLLRRYISLRKDQRWKSRPSENMLEIVKDIRNLNTRGPRSPELKCAVREKYLIERDTLCSNQT